MIIEEKYNIDEIKNLANLYMTFLGTYLICGLVCFLQDILIWNKDITKRKIQHTNKLEIIYLYKKTLNIVAKNIFFWVPLVFVGGGSCYIIFCNGTLGGNFYFDTYDIPKFAINFLLVDIFFYLSHRLFHFGILYSKYHKIHHELKKPISIGALYTHPVDCIATNILPVLLPIIILKEGIIISNIWIFISVVNTIYFSHTGERGRSEFHDLHHEKFKYNYGTNLIMDKIFGTYRE